MTQYHSKMIMSLLVSFLFCNQNFASEIQLKPSGTSHCVNFSGAWVGGCGKKAPILVPNKWIIIQNSCDSFSSVFLYINTKTGLINGTSASDYFIGEGITGNYTVYHKGLPSTIVKDQVRWNKDKKILTVNESTSYRVGSKIVKAKFRTELRLIGKQLIAPTWFNNDKLPIDCRFTRVPINLEVMK
ncbi:MAG: hypothetical protein HOE90_03880 [Bacteriovoracaceae bacterium]|jgi:hypothetical protein|nr:hypothetical protein [Bacteriovoracaceae bacterium]